jgi:glutaminyl-tRNA synthetase
LPVEVRLYSYLFNSKDPASLEDWLADLNPESLVVKSNSLADQSMKNIAEESRLQFERLGYFIIDTESTPEKTIFNRIVELKESKDKRDM